MNNLNIYLITSALLFSIGLAIVVSKKNLIMMLMGVELILNAVNINFVVFSKYDKVPEQGQIFALFIMIVAASEVAVGLAIILKIKKYYQNINPDSIRDLKN